MITQLNPPIPMSTPKGEGQAAFLIDYGIEHDLYWVVFIDDSRECWTFSNRDIRLQPNLTIGRGKFHMKQDASVSTIPSIEHAQSRVRTPMMPNA